MSKDLYESRTMYQKPTVLVITIICVMILAIFIIDFVTKRVSISKIDHDTLEVIKLIINEDSDKRKEKADNELKRLGYKNPNFNIIEDDDYVILVNNSSYFTIIGELTKKPKYYTSTYKAYFNEYHEIVAEKYIDQDEIIKNDNVIIK